MLDKKLINKKYNKLRLKLKKKFFEEYLEEKDKATQYLMAINCNSNEFFRAKILKIEEYNPEAKTLLTIFWHSNLVKCEEIREEQLEYLLFVFETNLREIQEEEKRKPNEEEILTFANNTKINYYLNSGKKYYD